MSNPEKNETEIPDKSPMLSEDNYQQIPNILVNDVRKNKIKPLDIVVWIVFSNHQRQKEHSWPSNKTIANFVGVNERTIIRSIGRLKAAGHLIRKGKTQYGTKYTSLLTCVKGSSVKRNKGITNQLNDETILQLLPTIEESQPTVAQLERKPLEKLSARTNSVFSEYIETNPRKNEDYEMQDDNRIPKIIDEFESVVTIDDTISRIWEENVDMESGDREIPF
jgi:Helix-turn-helix domain